MRRLLEEERKTLTARLREEDRPEVRHALALLDTRAEGLLVRLHTPGRGHPFRFEAVGREGTKEVREELALGYAPARQVTLPAHDGSLMVLPGHAPMVGLLGHGVVVLRTREASWPHPRLRQRTIAVPADAEWRLFVSGGAFQVEANEVLILAERGFVVGELTLEDLEDEERRRRLRTRILEEGLEGEALQKGLLEAKRAEAAAALAALREEKPSSAREERRQRYAAMHRALGA